MEQVTEQLLEDTAKTDVAALKQAADSYGDSWKKRGGVGAFMMLARKWDRIENQVKKSYRNVNNLNEVQVPPYDIFGHVHADNRSEGLIDDIRDLRRYLLLVEAELHEQGLDT